MPDGEVAKRLTYVQLAAARGISKASAERLVRNRKWPRVLGNDGVALIIVPPGEDAPGSSPRSGGGKPGGHARPGRPPRNPPPDHGEAPPPDFREAIRDVVAPLREQLDIANRRADGAEQRADEALAAERRAAQEVRDLREQLSDAHGAERIARDEAAGLRARLDQLQSRGLWARLRNKTC